MPDRINQEERPSPCIRAPNMRAALSRWRKATAPPTISPRRSRRWPARHDCGFAYLFHSLTAFDTRALAAAIRTHAPGARPCGLHHRRRDAALGHQRRRGAGDPACRAIASPSSRAMIDNIGSASMDGIAATVERLKRELAEATTGRPGLGRFALCLIDGMSFAEEAVTAAFHWALDDIPLIGGSAGDDLRFQTTTLISNGNVATDSRHHRADRHRRSLPCLQDRELRADRRKAGRHRLRSGSSHRARIQRRQSRQTSSPPQSASCRISSRR